jgi:ABC-type nickel/cobalt efflux system permease component RcnA
MNSIDELDYRDFTKPGHDKPIKSTPHVEEYVPYGVSDEPSKDAVKPYVAQYADPAMNAPVIPSYGPLPPYGMPPYNMPMQPYGSINPYAPHEHDHHNHNHSHHGHNHRHNEHQRHKKDGNSNTIILLLFFGGLIVILCMYIYVIYNVSSISKANAELIAYIKNPSANAKNFKNLQLIK